LQARPRGGEHACAAWAPREWRKRRPDPEGQRGGWRYEGEGEESGLGKRSLRRMRDSVGMFEGPRIYKKLVSIPVSRSR
jgi:hypothetical protein